MRLDTTSGRPLFEALASALEDAILAGSFPEETQLPSTTELAAELRLNPATALKAVNLLGDAGLCYKKRGMGMFVAAGAREKLLARRRTRFRDESAGAYTVEAKKLGISREELLRLTGEAFDQ